MKAAWLIGVLALDFCKDPEPDKVEVPEPIRGAYGRQAEDAYLDTLGLEVDVDTLRFSEMTVKIVRGEATSKQDFRIDEAEVTWARKDGEPKRCKGTIARQRDHLLLSLFELTRDRPCESSLHGEWLRWEARTTFPEPMRGTYGSKSPYTAFEGFMIEEEAVRWASGNGLQIAEAVSFAGKDTELIIRKGSYGQGFCRGVVSLEDRGLSGKLDPLADQGDAEVRCPWLRGERWSVDENRLPNKPLQNGKVRISTEGDTLTIETLDDQGLRCQQAVLRTEKRQVTEVGRDRIPVGAGDVLLLGPTEPLSGVEGCQERLRGLAAAECQEYLGMPCDPALIEALHADRPQPVGCPTHVIIGDPTTGGRKVALLPNNLVNKICFEMVGEFNE